MTALRLVKSHDSSVGIALGYGLDDQGSTVRFPAGAGNSSLHHPSRTALGVKRPGREADHSPPSSAEVKECMELYLHFQYVFMEWCLVKHSDNFTFTLLYFTLRFCYHLSCFLVSQLRSSGIRPAMP
jgi:hypothetical protein